MLVYVTPEVKIFRGVMYTWVRDIVDQLGKFPSKKQQLSRTQHFILKAHAAIFVLHIQYGLRGTPLSPMIQRQNCLLSWKKTYPRSLLDQFNRSLSTSTSFFSDSYLHTFISHPTDQFLEAFFFLSRFLSFFFFSFELSFLRTERGLQWIGPTPRRPRINLIKHSLV